MIKPLLPPLPVLPHPSLVRVHPTGLVTVADSIDAAVAGNSVRVDVWGMVVDGRVSAYIDPDTAIRFATELARLARAALSS
jgi:hypothetical protein